MSEGAEGPGGQWVTGSKVGHSQGDGSTDVGTQLLVCGGADGSRHGVKNDDEGVRPMGSFLQVLRQGGMEEGEAT